MTSRGQEEEVFSIRLENTVKKLGLSVHVRDSVHHKRKTELRIAVDVRDPVLDNESARQRISAMIAEHAHGVDLVFEEPLPPAFEGKLCWIWGRMARNAVDAGADYILLIGDDVELLTPYWQTEVEDEFSNIATRTGLPLGAACVALRDASFPAFPTFPVINRFHLEVFGELFPDEFRNQHGDPFLFLSFTGALELPALRQQPRCATRWVVVNLHGMPKRMRNRYGTAPYCLVLWLSFSLLLSRLVQSGVLASMWSSLHFDVIWRLSSD